MSSGWRLRERALSAAIPGIPGITLLVAAIVIALYVDFWKADWWQYLVFFLALGLVIPLLRGTVAILRDRSDPDDEQDDE